MENYKPHNGKVKKKNCVTEYQWVHAQQVRWLADRRGVGFSAGG